MLSEGQFFLLLFASVMSFTLWCENTELQAAILLPVSWVTLGYGLTKLNVTEHEQLRKRLLHLFNVFALTTSLWLVTANNIFFENTVGRMLDIWFDRDPLDLHTPGSGFTCSYDLFWYRYGGTIYFYYDVFASVVTVWLVTITCVIVAGCGHWMLVMGRKWDEQERLLNYVPPPPPVETKPKRVHFLPVKKYDIWSGNDLAPCVSWDPDWERRQRRINRRVFA